MKRILLLALALVLFFQFHIDSDASTVEETTEVVVCIDPGHGGENLGAEWLDYTEKEITLQVANAMKEELEKYQGIKVYMTRTSDVDMELADRVKYAKEVGADFFFCLHFNMSVNHDIYGTENWISAFGKNYARGMDFAKIEMSLLTDLGLYDRGIKTRLNKKGINYYGVLRVADEEGIPGVIIEHCHLDNYNDEPFYDHDEWLTKYGQLDATAVAMYYGLKSEELGKDYSTYSYEPTPVPSSAVRPDTSDPEISEISIGDIKEETIYDEDGNITDYKSYVPISITAKDPDCRMLYYSVSFDGGETFSERYPWRGDGNEVGDTINTTIELPYGRNLDLAVNAYNMFDLVKLSNVISIDGLVKPEIPVLEEEETYEETGINSDVNSLEDYTTITHTEEEALEQKSISDNRLLLVVLIVLAILALAVMLFFAYLIMELGKNNRRKKRKNRHK